VALVAEFFRADRAIVEKCDDPGGKLEAVFDAAPISLLDSPPGARTNSL
jgi:hypothetical protein